MSGVQPRGDAPSEEREAMENAVFEALDGVYRLPSRDAIEAAGLIAGQIAAFLADIAQLSDDSAAIMDAREALGELSSDCRELIGDIQRDRAADLARCGREAVEVFSAAPTPVPMRNSCHNIALFAPRSGHRWRKVTPT
ncbi:MAG: hypothetical protein VYD87_07385 [Pseudomonadota bacterium]|nr:hypothetical protein [Pseudomonadota bacterium]